MKERRTKDRHTGARTLQVRTTRGENLDYSRAEWLVGARSAVLLPFRYEATEHKSLLYYDITGLPTLPEYLGMGISGMQYISLLRSVQTLGELCASSGLPTEMLRFEPENVYVRDEGMVFCCLPLTPPSPQRMQILQLMEYLAGGNVRFVLQSDAELAGRTLDFVRRHQVFSSFEFGQWLSGSFGVPVSSGRPSVQSGGQSGNAPGQGVQEVFDPFAASSTSSSPQVQNGPSPKQAPVGGVSVKVAQSVFSPDAESHGNPASGGGNADDCAQTLPSLRYPPRDSPVQSVEPSGTRALSGALAHGAESVAFVEGAAVSAGPLNTASSVDMSGGFAGPAVSPPVGFIVVREKDGSRLHSASSSAVIGRSSSCAICVRGNTNISRRHATVADLGGGGFGVTDLGSANGTMVRGMKVPQGEIVQVSLGESFRLADETFHIER